ncbi:MAG: hypothetical protein HY022_08265 [Chloroflexi bacterium]|nr:hypothetical protein [Chloroflexota bacterium]
MNDLNILIGQMAGDISSQALRLDDVRLRLFMEWMHAHSTKVKAATQSEAQSFQLGQVDVVSIRDGKMGEQLKAGLQTWFESLPMQGMLWEYHLILDEIAWWRDLDARRLAMILKDETGNLALPAPVPQAQVSEANA